MLEVSDLETRADLMGLEDETEFETQQDENETYHTGGSEEEVYNYVGRVDDNDLYDNLKSEVLKDVRKYINDRLESEVEEDEDIIEEDIEDAQVIRPIEIYYQAPDAPDASDVETISSNQVFILDDEQFQSLLAEIRTNTEETRPIVVDNSVSNDLIPVKNAGESSFIVSVITFGLLFGYLAKESIFKGV